MCVRVWCVRQEGAYAAREARVGDVGGEEDRVRAELDLQVVGDGLAIGARRPNEGLDHVCVPQLSVRVASRVVVRVRSVARVRLYLG